MSAAETPLAEVTASGIVILTKSSGEHITPSDNVVMRFENPESEDLPAFYARLASDKWVDTYYSVPPRFLNNSLMLA